MDAPKNKTFKQLVEMANDRKVWKKIVKAQFKTEEENASTTTTTTTITRITRIAAKTTIAKQPTDAGKYRKRDDVPQWLYENKM